MSSIRQVLRWMNIVYVTHFLANMTSLEPVRNERQLLGFIAQEGMFIIDLVMYIDVSYIYIKISYMYSHWRWNYNAQVCIYQNC